jgi:hypothetical protein
LPYIIFTKPWFRYIAAYLLPGSFGPVVRGWETQRLKQRPRSRFNLGLVMTETEILELIKALRDLAMRVSDGSGLNLARELRSFADNLEEDLRSGKIPRDRS